MIQEALLGAKTWIRRVSWTLLGLAVSGLIVVLYVLPAWEFLSEPTAEEWVQLSANWLASTSAGPELEALADRLMKEHDPNALELPEAKFSNHGRALPVERLPAKFRERGGNFGEPQLFVRLDPNAKPEVLVVSWGHRRQAILVYRKEPAEPPRGFSVRAATARTYVVADEKWSSTAPVSSSGKGPAEPEP